MTAANEPLESQWFSMKSTEMAMINVILFGVLPVVHMVKRASRW